MALTLLPASEERRQVEDELYALLDKRDAVLWEYWRLRASNQDPLRAELRAMELKFLQARVRRLQELFDRAAIREAAAGQPDAVGIGSWVWARWTDGDEVEYRVVDPQDVDVLTGWLSYDSPIGQSLIGKRPGDSAEVATPAGPQRLDILSVA
jgi:transcription elongation GreA/GreB family factor